MQFVLTKDIILHFEEAAQHRDEALVRSLTADLHAADISAILEELEAEHCAYILGLLDRAITAEIITNFEEDMLSIFLQKFSPEQIALLLEQQVDSDDAVDILAALPLKLREQIISFFKDTEFISYVLDLLHYEEDCAGGLMAKELIKANIHWTVNHCIEEIRRQAEKVDKIITIYVVDDDDILLGRLSVKRLILSSGTTLIKNIYHDEIEAVYSYDSSEVVADIAKKYDLEAVPVINVNGKLIGRITVDDIIDVITEQAESDIQAMSGISEDIEEDDSVWKLSRARLPWLVIGMIGGMVGAQFIGLFEKDLALVPAMAFFIPLIMATGGNVGIQSSTIIVQALANSSGLQENIWRRLFKSVAVAILNGMVISMLVFSSNLLIGGDINLSLVVASALFSVVLIASMMGTITPIILNKIGINPALASGPFITTANDLMGLAIYFSVARVML